MKPIKVIIEKHPDGYVAYPLGLKGIVVGQGDSYDEALADVTSAIKFHVETFGLDELDGDPPVLEAFLTEAQVAVA
ncbi:MAG TPA: type II toxin-antitoxin system HicB family antitoxin [Phycisphaerae bacterium]|nr:type II toxin-antitoxin system HicB family antitoxin [Phycisphaerae bacterium]